MRLNVYLKQRGITTGPRSKKANTSHSALDVILKFLTNREQFKGSEKQLIFGSAFHNKFLINCSKVWRRLTPVDRKHVTNMVAKLEAHPVVKKLMEGAMCEKKRKTFLNGVKVAYILDIHQKHKLRGADLKTTSCKTFEDFVASAIAYGYIRQGETYKVAEGLKEFIFVGIQKEPPYNVYILDVSLYPEEIKYAIEELEFLLYFYQNYGKVLKGGVDLRSYITKTNGFNLTYAVIDEYMSREENKAAIKKVSKLFVRSGYKFKTFNKK